MTINIIAPHLHLFDRTLGDYHWLKTENPPFWPDKEIIQRDFSITDLMDNSAPNRAINLSGFVHIEAGFDNDSPWRELAYIEGLAIEGLATESLGIESISGDSLANDNLKPLKLRTVAAIDLLASPAQFNSTLQKLQQHSSLIGVRHILDEQALFILSNQNAQDNLAQLNAFNLNTFNINTLNLNKSTGFIFELQLPLAAEVSNKFMPLLKQTIANNSQLSFIINHAGFPPTDINSSAWHQWQSNITELAKYSNVFVKCSGMEMVDRQYKMSWFSTVTSFCISEFSLERVMLASNFPLCLLGDKVGNELSKQSYQGYWQDILESTLIKQCSEKEKSALLYDNALKIYQL